MFVSHNFTNLVNVNGHKSCTCALVLRRASPVHSTFAATNKRVVGDPAIAEANKKVVRVQERKSKHGQYHSYDPQFHIKIAKYACENGNKSRPSLVLLFLRQQK